MIRSAFQFTGNKKKAINNGLIGILEKSEKPILVDMMTGSGVVALNWKGESIINDVHPVLINLHSYLDQASLSKILADILNVLAENDITDEATYYKLRSRYNETRESALLLILIQISFNSLFRFNKKGGYNAPFGHNLKKFGVERIVEAKGAYSKIIGINDVCMNDFLYDSYSPDNHVFYFDPPYHFTKYNYGVWGEKEEIDFWQTISSLNHDGYKFAISNVIRYRGKENTRLVQECIEEGYLVNVISGVKYNSWKHAVDSVEHNGKTVEVLITNYTGEKLAPF